MHKTYFVYINRYQGSTDRTWTVDFTLIDLADQFLCIALRWICVIAILIQTPTQLYLKTFQLCQLWLLTIWHIANNHTSDRIKFKHRRWSRRSSCHVYVWNSFTNILTGDFFNKWFMRASQWSNHSADSFKKKTWIIQEQIFHFKIVMFSKCSFYFHLFSSLT